MCFSDMEDLSIALKVFKNAVYESQLQVKPPPILGQTTIFRCVLTRSKISTPEVQSGSSFAAVLQLSRGKRILLVYQMCARQMENQISAHA